MLPDRVSNPGPLTYETGALPIALRGLNKRVYSKIVYSISLFSAASRSYVKENVHVKAPDGTILTRRLKEELKLFCFIIKETKVKLISSIKLIRFCLVLDFLIIL